jgi:YVTN family beta-propeller protein
MTRAPHPDSSSASRSRNSFSNGRYRCAKGATWIIVVTWALVSILVFQPALTFGLPGPRPAKSLPLIANPHLAASGFLWQFHNPNFRSRGLAGSAVLDRFESDLNARTSLTAGPSVVDTLVLFNNSLEPGNFRAANGQFPEGGTFDSGNGDLYVSNYFSNNIDVIGGLTSAVVKSIPVGSAPLGVAYDSRRGELFVANYGSNSVSVINDTSDNVVTTIALGPGAFPWGVAYDGAKDEIFVGDAGTGQAGFVRVINDSTNEIVQTISVGLDPSALAYDSGMGEVYIANFDSNTVSVVNDTTNKVTANISVGLGPDAVAYDPEQQEIFVANFGASSDNLTIINDSTDKTVGSIPMGGNPTSAVWDDRKDEIFVSNSGTDNVTIASGKNRTIVASVPEGTSPVLAGYDGQRGRVFVANSVDDVTVINDTTNSIERTIAVGSFPDAEVYDSSNGELYVADLDSPEVYVIDGETNSVEAQVGVGNQPQAVTYDSAKGEIFVANYLSNSVTVINDSDNRVVTTIPVGVNPDGIAYDGSKGEVFVANFLSKNVSILSDSSNSVVGSVGVGVDPGGVSYDARRGEVFVANYASNNVSIINDTTDKVTANPRVGNSPFATLSDNDVDKVFVADIDSTNLSVINDTTNSVIGTVPVGENPAGLAYDATLGEIFVANDGSNNISVVNASTDVVTGNVTVGASPWGVAFNSRDATVDVGNYLDGTLSIVSPVSYPVSFHEVGLPGGVGWYLNVTGQAGIFASGTTATIGLGNGTYNYTIATSDKQYQPLDASGAFTVAGHQVVENSTFTLVTYTVTFTEVGLPLGVNWSVTIRGSTWATVATQVNLSEPNGTFGYSVASSDLRYRANPSEGYGVVRGLAIYLGIDFQDVVYSVTFVESGLAPTTGWFANVTGQPPTYSTGANVSLFLTNGTYNFTIGSTDKTYFAIGGSLTVNGAPTYVSVTFSRIVYTVTFTESGLPTWALWTVVVNGTIGSGSGPLVFELPNGTFPWVVETVPANYTAAPTEGVIMVCGGSTSLQVVITLAVQMHPGTAPRLTSPWVWVATAAITATALAATVLAVRRRKRRS